MALADPVLAARYRALALQAASRPIPSRFIAVDVQRQRLGLVDEGRLLAEFPVSTAAAGTGSEEGSYRTPLGWHRIHRKIGAEAPSGTVFRSRIPTGEIWQGEPLEEDLILTRILTLEGLEEGVNRGPGRDSLQRYIYIHGTNQEAHIGEPVSHGCVRMTNADIQALFELLKEGDEVVILQGLEDRLGLGRLHFAGIGGSGMSALAQYVAMRGGQASGSDRSFDRGLHSASRQRLENLGIAIHPQDGSGLQDCSALIYSTAVEEHVPDFAEAKRQGIPLIHRSELLAHFVASQRTVAVTGTSGKSTTVAMIFEILRGAGRDPSVITGGDLLALQQKGLWGNAWAGESDLLVIEADESDGSVVRYQPAIGVVLNLQKDHKEMEVVADMFRSFKNNLREALVLGEAPNLEELASGAIRFGFGPQASVRAEAVQKGPESSQFSVQGVPFRLPVPGQHNLENALAAMAACQALGVPLEAMTAPLENFQGVGRRFQLLGEHRGVQVIDDFGHNPAKVAASIRTAHLRARRVLAVYQPHGYGPTRFLWQDFVEAFSRELRPEDQLWMLEVFYAGGTATRDFSAADMVADIAQKGTQAAFAPSREWLATQIAAEAQKGDLVLVMGARDPSLTDLAKTILASL